MTLFEKIYIFIDDITPEAIGLNRRDKMTHKFIILLTGVALFLIVFFSLSFADTGFYSREELIDNSETCLNCHDDMGQSLSNSAHRLYSKNDLPATFVAGCIGCHDGWKTHIDDPSADNIEVPSKETYTKQAEVCGRCHENPHQAAMATDDPHNRAQVGCLSCHKIHNNVNKSLLADDDDNFCLTCHKGVAGEFHRRSVHPLNSGNIRCIDCHKMGSIEDPMLAVGMDFRCQECHAEKSGPFLYEHKIVYHYSTQGGSCMECHQPHGSPNDRLLNQPGNGICMQCHMIPPKHRTQHDGLGTKLACVECHSEIHGSYSNKYFLDPELGTKLFPDCNQSGCHSFAN